MSSRSASVKRRQTPKVKVTSSTVGSDNSEVNEDVLSKDSKSRASDKNCVVVQIEHQDGCDLANELILRIQEEIPTAKINTVLSDEDVFEITINEKMVFSRKLLNEWPKVEEIVEICYWLSHGRTFMHMYLCTYMEGGALKMELKDKERTPFVKRAILACVIS